MPASLAEASRATRVRVDFLEAMERDSFNFISGQVYVRGMLRSYATWLRLDPGEIIAEFDRAYGGTESPPLTSRITSAKEAGGLSVRPRKPQWAVVGSVALAVLVVLLSVSLLGGGGGKVAPPQVLSGSPTPSPAVSSPPASPPPAPPPPSGVNLVVSVVKGTSWVHVIVGQTVPALVSFQGILGTGVSRTFETPDVLQVDFGNMGAVDVKVNGKDLGSPGPFGRNGAFLITPAGTLTPDPTAVSYPPPGQRILFS